MESAVVFEIQSAIILSIFTYGLYQRKNKQIHTKVMLGAIIWDILLVLQIELNRGAIAKASKALSNPMILNIHVAMALTCVVAYFFMLYSGKFLKIGEFKLRSLHKKVGIFAYVLRIATFITSFYAVVPKN
jgi:hypothetical protein